MHRLQLFNLMHYIFYVLFIFSVLSSNDCFAFFQVNEHLNNSWIEHTTIDSPTQGNNLYHIYDNYSFEQSTVYLGPPKKHFLSFDQIEIDISLRLLTKNLTDEENAIDRMVAANLRLRQLLDTYINFKKKSGVLLRQTQKVASEKIQNDHQLQKSDTSEEIDIEREKLKKALSSIYLSNAVSGNPDLIDNIIPESYANLAVPVEKTPPNMDLVNLNQTTAGSEQNDNKTYEQNVITDVDRPLYKNEKMPWLIEFSLKLLDYIKNNRIEISLYAIFLFLIIFLVSLKVQQR